MRSCSWRLPAVLILCAFCCTLLQQRYLVPAAQAGRPQPVLYKICNASISEEWCDVQGCVALHRFARGAPGADHLRPAAVTLATQLDIRLLDRLAAVSTQWGGPVSSAIALQAVPVPGGGELRALCSALRSLPLNVDVHLLHPLPVRAASAAPPPYNQNRGRAIAIAMARTELLLHADVDFLASQAAGTLLEQLLSRTPADVRAIWAVPAFEPAGGSECPTTVRGLASAVREGSVRMFHASGAGQRAISFQRWLNASLAEAGDAVHPIADEAVGWGFEPFFAFRRRDNVPRFDAQFAGRGFNRISQIMEARASGLSIRLAPGVFLCHPPASIRGMSRREDGTASGCEGAMYTGRNRGCAQVRANYVRMYTRFMPRLLDEHGERFCALYPDRCTQIRAAAELRPPGDPPPPSSACEPHSCGAFDRVARVAHVGGVWNLSLFSTLCFEGPKEGWVLPTDKLSAFASWTNDHGARAAFANAGFKRYDHGARAAFANAGFKRYLAKPHLLRDEGSKREFLASRKWIAGAAFIVDEGHMSASGTSPAHFAKRLLRLYGATQGTEGSADLPIFEHLVLPTTPTRNLGRSWFRALRKLAYPLPAPLLHTHSAEDLLAQAPVCFEHIAVSGTEDTYFVSAADASRMRGRAYKLAGVAREPECGAPRSACYFRRSEGMARRVSNEADVLAAIATRFGRVRIVGLDSSSSFTEQVSTFASCDLLVSVHGSHNANIMWMRPGAAFLEINPPKFYYDSYMRLSGVAGLLYVQSRNNTPAHENAHTRELRSKYGALDDVACTQIKACHGLARKVPTQVELGGLELGLRRAQQHLDQRDAAPHCGSTRPLVTAHASRSRPLPQLGTPRCWQRLRDSYDADSNWMKEWLRSSWQFKLAGCSGGDPQQWCTFSGEPCLWGNMPPHKLLFIASAGRALGVTHLIETGRKGGASVMAYAQLGFQVASVELVPLPNVARTLRALAPAVRQADGDGNEVVPALVEEILSRTPDARIALVVDGPKGAAGLELIEKLLPRVVFAVLDDVRAGSDLRARINHTHAGASVMLDDPQWIRPTTLADDTRFLSQFQGYASCDTTNVTSDAPWAVKQRGFRDATFYVAEHEAALLAGGQWERDVPPSRSTMRSTGGQLAGQGWPSCPVLDSRVAAFAAPDIVHANASWLWAASPRRVLPEATDARPSRLLPSDASPAVVWTINAQPSLAVQRQLRESLRSVVEAWRPASSLVRLRLFVLVLLDAAGGPPSDRVHKLCAAWRNRGSNCSVERVHAIPKGCPAPGHEAGVSGASERVHVRVLLLDGAWRQHAAAGEWSDLWRRYYAQQARSARLRADLVLTAGALMFMRWVAPPLLLPQYGVRRAIFVDADTCALTDVAGLYATPLSASQFMASAMRPPADTWSDFERINANDGIVRAHGFHSSTQQSFNAGVVLADLLQMCEQEVARSMLALARARVNAARLLWNTTDRHVFDQPIFEIAAARSMRYVDARWNCRRPDYAFRYCFIVHAKSCSLGRQLGFNASHWRRDGVSASPNILASHVVSS